MITNLPPRTPRRRRCVSGHRENPASRLSPVEKTRASGLFRSQSQSVLAVVRQHPGGGAELTGHATEVLLEGRVQGSDDSGGGRHPLGRAGARGTQLERTDPGTDNDHPSDGEPRRPVLRRNVLASTRPFSRHVLSMY